VSQPRGRAATLALLLLAVLSPAASSAQAPGPARPGSIRAPRGQDATAAEKTPSSSWRFELSAEGAWYENPYFLNSPEGTAWSTNGRAGLRREQRFQGGSFTLGAFGGTLYYPEANELNQPTFGGAFQLDWQAGRNTKLRLGQTYERSNTRNFTPIPADVPLPTSELDSARSTLELEHRLSRRWLMTLGGSFTYRRYEDDLLTDGDDVEGNFRLGRSVSRHGLLHLGYVYSSSFIGAERLRAHQVLLGGSHQPERGLGFEIAGGAGYVESTGEYYPSGRFGLSAKGRRTTLAAVYYRSFGQAYGYGRQTIGDFAAAKLTWKPGRPLSFEASYNFGYQRDPADESYTIRSWIALGGFDWEIGGGVAFAARYGWESNETKGFPLVEGGRATAMLRYGVDWK